MSRSRRTLLSVFVFLSLMEKIVLCQISLGTLPVSAENCPNFKSITSPSANAKSDLLSAAQKLFVASQRPVQNDYNIQPLIAKAPVITIEPSYQQVPINVNPAPNLIVPFIQTTRNTAGYSSPETLLVQKSETTPSLAISSAVPSTLEYFNVDQQNYQPIGRMPFGQISETVSLPQALYIENYVQQPDLTQFYQSPVTVQTATLPATAPFKSYVSPIPSTRSQNLFVGTGDLVQSLCPVTISSPQIPASTQIETVPVGLGYNVIDSGSAVPLSLQINMPTPAIDQPIVLLSSASPAPGYQDISYMPPMPPAAPPLIVMERSRSRWRNVLPILLIALWDDGCCQNWGNNGCSGGCNIPIPYPIPIPTNNPIILNRDNKKGKDSNQSEDDC